MRNVESRIRDLEKTIRKPCRFYLVTREGKPLDPLQEKPKSRANEEPFQFVDPKPRNREYMGAGK